MSGKNVNGGPAKKPRLTSSFAIDELAMAFGWELVFEEQQKEVEIEKKKVKEEKKKVEEEKKKVEEEKKKVQNEKKKVEEEKKMAEDEKKKVADEKKKAEDEKRKIEEEKRKMDEEREILKTSLDELRGLIECPVCLYVPRGRGPVPVCNNGHIVCRPCRDQIRLQVGEEQAKCPSCMVNLGNNTSLIASRLVEKVKHECENFGCEEMIPFSRIESHQEKCLFRKIICPGSGRSCKLEMSVNKVEEHMKVCPDTRKDMISNNTLWTRTTTQAARDSDKLFLWPTQIVAAHGKTFFLRHKKDKLVHFFEVIMLGSEAECSDYVTSIEIQKPGQETNSKIFAKYASQPRPIDLQSWGDVGFLLSGKALSRILTPKEDMYAFGIILSIEKI